MGALSLVFVCAGAVHYWVLASSWDSWASDELQLAWPENALQSRNPCNCHTATAVPQDYNVSGRGRRVRLGLQTISWGPNIADLDRLVEVAAELGYQGLEFAQSPDALPPAHELKSVLARNNLCLVGLAGGHLKRRVEYAGDLDAAYLYIDEWDERAVVRALESGFAVGIHPHRYKGIERIAEAEPHLERHPRVGLILDTAHAYLAGDDLLSGVSRHASRVLAVHFKDWTRLYGTSPLRFARGFVALGQGELSDLLEQTLSALTKRAYEGWIIVEQDTPHGDPAEAARVSRQWLAERGL